MSLESVNVLTLPRKRQQPLEHYFKKAVNKPQPNGIGGVDFVYMITLNEDRFRESARQLSQYAIHAYRFEAVNGSALPQDAIDQLGAPTFCEGMSRKSIGIVLSHLSVLQDAYESGYETVWVMEEDIQVIENPGVLSDLIVELDRLVGDWDILYTDFESKVSNGRLVPCLAVSPRPNVPVRPLAYYLRRKCLSENFTEIGMRYGCYSMIIRRSGIKKILKYFKKHRIYLPIDMDLLFIPGLKQITCNREIVSHMPDHVRPHLHSPAYSIDLAIIDHYLYQGDFSAVEPIIYRFAQRYGPPAALHLILKLVVSSPLTAIRSFGHSSNEGGRKVAVTLALGQSIKIALRYRQLFGRTHSCRSRSISSESGK